MIGAADARYESNTQARFACLQCCSMSNNVIRVARRDTRQIADGYEILIVDAPDLGVFFSVAFDHAPSSKVSDGGYATQALSPGDTIGRHTTDKSSRRRSSESLFL